jgi:hypothetical protein
MAPRLSVSKPAFAAPSSKGTLRLALAWGGAGLGALLLVATLALWFHYGTTVFFETIAAGFASCF